MSPGRMPACPTFAVIPSLLAAVVLPMVVQRAHAQSTPRIKRFAGNPIIRPDMLRGDDGADINGPSLIRVPVWIEQPLGKYYLYFAHHEGRYIRLAYADTLAGPWTIHHAGTLRLEQTRGYDIPNPAFHRYRHIASPDVHVDDDRRRIRMYFHCPVYISGDPASRDSYRQVTMAALSKDGIHFQAHDAILGNAYFRVFRWEGYDYAMGMPGVLYRSRTGLDDFVQGPTLFGENMRHSALMVDGHTLLVFYTLVGDAPERILLSRVDLRPDWMTWKATEPVLVLEPEEPWEGADLPAKPSRRGSIHARVRQLRDPAVFKEDGRTYLLYAVAGEAGIAIAGMDWPPASPLHPLIRPHP